MQGIQQLSSLQAIVTPVVSHEGSASNMHNHAICSRNTAHAQTVDKLHPCLSVDADTCDLTRDSGHCMSHAMCAKKAQRCKSACLQEHADRPEGWKRKGRPYICAPVPPGSPSSLLRALPATLKAQQLWLADGSLAAAMWLRAWHGRGSAMAVGQVAGARWFVGGM